MKLCRSIAGESSRLEIARAKKFCCCRLPASVGGTGCGR